MNLNIAIPKNAYGVWSVPSLNIQLPVYLKNNSTRQQIVDNKESALIDPWVNAYRICDHFCSVGLNGKGVWSMQQIMLGAEAYMTKPDGCYQYECYMTAIADVQSYGYTVGGRLLTPLSSLDILNVCCVGLDSKRNYVAVFRCKRKLKSSGAL